MSKLAVLFPGQGAQYSGMGTSLYNDYAKVRNLYGLIQPALGYDLVELMFTGDAEELQLTEHTQPAILAHSIAAWTVLCSILPQSCVEAAGGLSLGEFSALVAAGVLDFSEALSVVRERGIAMQNAVPIGEGGMAAVLGLAADVILPILHDISGKHGVLQIANFNAPGQIVISGQMSALDAVVEPLRAAGAARVVTLPVSAPFHSSMLKPAAERLSHVLSEVVLSEFNLPVVANVTASFHPSLESVKPLLVQQVTSPVRWEQSIRFLIDQGCDLFVELGPGTTLSQFVRRIARDSGASVGIASLDKSSDLDNVRQVLAPLLAE